ncbi:hypothetical protein J6590_087350 [Homalodisca vitripennis]|nr:hypothetical protein J6590_087350 [Homalodisca vitripennis]
MAYQSKILEEVLHGISRVIMGGRLILSVCQRTWLCQLSEGSEDSRDWKSKNVRDRMLLELAGYQRSKTSWRWKLPELWTIAKVLVGSKTVLLEETPDKSSLITDQLLVVKDLTSLRLHLELQELIGCICSSRQTALVNKHPARLSQVHVDCGISLQPRFDVFPSISDQYEEFQKL